jgi:hypothetical protein
MAQLAAAIADQTGHDPAPFVRYANAHLIRMMPPVLVITGRAAIRKVRWSMVPAACRALIALRRYNVSGDAASDEHAERRIRMRRGLDDTLRLFDDGVPEPYRELILDHFADLLAQTPAESEDAPD